MNHEQQQPGGREPAPGQLGLVQAFVNTNDIEGRRDALAGPEPARVWLRERELLGPADDVAAEEFLRLIEVREALRALALANNGGPPAERAVASLNDAAASALRVEFNARAAVLRPRGTGVDGAIGQLLAIVAAAMREDRWVRMKACRRDVCRWLFYDHSRNRASSWCAMSVCGNRTKTRTYRRRQSAAREAR